MSTPSTRILVLLFAAVTLLAVALFGPGALVVFFTSGFASLAILLAAFGLGHALLAAFPFKHESLATQAVLAAALGTGTLSLLVLTLGAAGVMSRIVWIAIVLALDAVAGWRIARPAASWRTAPMTTDATSGPQRWLVLVLGLFLAFGILAATMPPGLLWPAEGYGYDVLEYHLGAPRAYFDAGRISYLPGNIYSNFPFNIEMLYLLSMILHGDPIRGVFTAKIVNLLLGLLAVVAIWRIGARVSPRVGLLAALLAGSAPFLVYLSGVAYVENGMLFFTAAALLATLSLTDPAKPTFRQSVAAGALAGFAAGCKYTALPMVALPLLLFATIETLRRRANRWAPPAMLLGIAIALSPWLLKNAMATGNPVFPLATKWLGYSNGIWDSADEDRWIAGHEPAVAETSLTHRISRLSDQVLFSRQFGPMVSLGIASLIGVGGLTLSRRYRGSGVSAAASRSTTGSLLRGCGFLVFVGLYVWLFHTHLVDRFAIALVVPCAVALAIGLERTPASIRYQCAILGVSLVALFNVASIWQLFSNDGQSFLAIDAFGHTDWMTSADSPFFPHVASLNRIVDNGGRILVVGDAKGLYLQAGADTCVVFNRNPFAEAAATMSPTELVAWLRARGYTHLYVDWVEMHRLRSTYGFWNSITPELFERMRSAGLRPIRSFTRKPGIRPYATLFELPSI